MLLYYPLRYLYRYASSGLRYTATFIIMLADSTDDINKINEKGNSTKIGKMPT